MTGPSGFGFGDDDATDVGPADPFTAPPVSIFMRKIFTVDANSVQGMILHIDYDDGFVAYLNGTEIARANVGISGDITSYDTFADVDHEAQIYSGGKPDEFRIDNFSSLLRDGENILAIQVHNSQQYSSDMTLIPFLTLEMNSVPINSRGVASILGLEIPHLHTNFKLSSSGEQIVIFDFRGVLVDSITFGAIPVDYSFGRKPDGGNQWLFFDDPTPGGPNGSTAYLGQVEAPQVSKAGGFYTGPIEILINSTAGAESFFTRDGSTPTMISNRYTAPISIDSTSILRVRSFSDGYLPSQVITQTYLIGTDFTLPVVSLTTDPGNFFDPDTGIYVFGQNADTVNYPYWGSNFWEDWERPVHVEFFEPDGNGGFALDAGVQIFGSWSRLYPQKSLAIFARGRYGTDAIDYPVFPDLPIDSYQALVLRNSGQDWGHAHFRDMMIHDLVAKATDLDVQAGRPAIVLLNGQNWGIYNIREKINEHYIASHYNVDSDDIDMIAEDDEVLYGDRLHYQALMDFVNTNDLSDSMNYATIQTMMDVDNFLNYIAVEIFIGNSDWPWNNVKIWRPRTDTGRWRWILYDTDYGFHCGHYTAATNTFLEMDNEENDTALLFSKLMENKDCEIDFITRFADLLNTIFHPYYLTQEINRWRNLLSHDMPYHIQRWQRSFSGPWWLGKSIDSMDEWDANIQVALEFGMERGGYVRQHINDEFGPTNSQTVTISLNVIPACAGKIKINTISPYDYPWSGKYFSQVPIRLSAIPERGYRFAGWTGIEGDSTSVRINCIDGQQITALFEADSTSSVTVVINEINYKSESSFDPGDWIELYNPGETSLDLSGWVFQDSEDDHAFELPSQTILPPDGYCVICNDTVAFRMLFPSVRNIVGNVDFGLSSAGELIRLYDDSGILVDSVRYRSDLPWPTESNGGGATLALIDPLLNNALPENWAASEPYGTPGAENNETDVEKSSDLSEIPTTFSLNQNYPNPFNASTMISFTLPIDCFVEIAVFDLKGKDMIQLVKREMPVGYHRIEWSGTDKWGNLVSSGLYLYVLKAGNYRECRKMVLLR
ncbi:MAG: CotH kinase family protein [Candidatus Neomarinimicrobiota bacterium]